MDAAQALVEVPVHEEGDGEGDRVGDYLCPEDAVDLEEIVHKVEQGDIEKSLTAG